MRRPPRLLPLARSRAAASATSSRAAFVEIIESGLAAAESLDDFGRRIGDNAVELAQLAPSLRRVFPDIPQPLELPPAL
jgi:hypothetical protein